MSRTRPCFLKKPALWPTSGKPLSQLFGAPTATLRSSSQQATVAPRPKTTHVASADTDRVIGLVILVSADPAEMPANNAVQPDEVPRPSAHPRLPAEASRQQVLRPG